MSTATAFQPTPAHQLQSHEALNNTKSTKSTKSAIDAVPRGPVDASLLFYAPPTDGSKVQLMFSSLIISHTNIIIALQLCRSLGGQPT
jgi:hypothetical protein